MHILNFPSQIWAKEYASYLAKYNIGHLLFIHWPMNGLALWAIVNNAATHVGVQIFLQVPAFDSFKFMPASRIAESFIILRLIFWDTITTLHAHWRAQGFQLLLVLALLPGVGLFVLDSSCPDGVRWHLLVVLTCIPSGYVMSTSSFHGLIGRLYLFGLPPFLKQGPGRTLGPAPSPSP